MTDSTHTGATGQPAHELPFWLAPLLFAATALCVVLPLIVNGSSCGHDFDFHLLSWMEAAHQWQHGILKPVWAFTPAFNAGEPRLLLYPPLSWATGAALGMLLPWPAVPVAYTALVLSLSGLTMQRLLRRAVSPMAAVLGGCLYLCNPYMLFVAYERSAYAELMAAAWMPLLLAAMLRERVSAIRIALPVALLWLTNAPAAVVGCYAVLLLGLLRLALMHGSWLGVRLRVAATVAGGFVLALLLDAFYLLPLAVERRFVQLQLAVVPMARPDHNFLFQRDNDAFHTHVLQQASWIAVGLCLTGAVCGALLLVQRAPLRHYRSMHARDVHAPAFSTRQVATVLLCFVVIMFLLLTRWSAPVWHLGPELTFMQFPWRFLAVVSAAVVALLVVLVHQLLPRIKTAVALPAVLVPALLVGWFAGGGYFREGCADDETVAAQHKQFIDRVGVSATDEYTPTGADNDTLPINAPPAWLASAASQEPGSTPRLPAIERPSPEDLRFHTPALANATTLVVRLRRFAGWHTLRDGVETNPAARADGLLAVPLPPGSSHDVRIVYRTTGDQWVGLGVSAATLLLVGVALRRRRVRYHGHRHDG